MKDHYDISMPPEVCFPFGQVPSVRPAFVAAVAAGAAWMAVFFVDPAMQSFLPPCLFHAFTGLYCPGCGATRALHRLVHGDFVCRIQTECAIGFGIAVRLPVCSLPQAP